jgi:predicted TIM-barrel fold metal-dependent hydrolase
MAEDEARWSYADYFSRLDSGKYKGLKLYPALGYYPFDWRIIPIFQYALNLGLPVMTHCSRGPVYYRGRWKAQDFGTHPFNGMALERKPTFGTHRTHFSANFTHPLNYLVLTNPDYLQQYLTNVKLTPAELEFVKENNLDAMFKEAPDLRKLKICLAHWGSGEEWDRYLTDYTFRPIDRPLEGLTSIEKFEEIWETYSWYSIINHMISDSTYRFYTDISFTLHDAKYLNLLKVSLIKDEIASRVLFGTDFYVVSHKETEREFSIDVRGYIGEENWKRIAEVNPMTYLHSHNFPSE